MRSLGSLRSASLVSLIALGACSGDRRSIPDAASLVDTGVGGADAGSTDVGSDDLGLGDAGLSEVGTSSDAGPVDTGADVCGDGNLGPAEACDEGQRNIIRGEVCDHECNPRGCAGLMTPMFTVEAPRDDVQAGSGAQNYTVVDGSFLRRFDVDLAGPRTGGCFDVAIYLGSDDGGELLRSETHCADTFAGDERVRVDLLAPVWFFRAEIFTVVFSSAAGEPEISVGISSANPIPAGELIGVADADLIADVYFSVEKDCAEVVCGDGVIAPPEICDDGTATAACDDDCTIAECGDGLFNPLAEETCDTGQETVDCDDDCTVVECGDRNVNQAAGEACDDGVETPTCNLDCSVSRCGDQIENAAAGETCDLGNGNGALVRVEGCDSECIDRGCPLPEGSVADVAPPRDAASVGGGYQSFTSPLDGFLTRLDANVLNPTGMPTCFTVEVYLGSVLTGAPIRSELHCPTGLTISGLVRIDFDDPTRFSFGEAFVIRIVSVPGQPQIEVGSRANNPYPDGSFSGDPARDMVFDLFFGPADACAP